MHCLWLALPVLLALSVPGACQGAAGAGRMVLGYDTGQEAVPAFPGELTAVAADRFQVDASGGLAGTLRNPGLLAFDRAHGLATFACVGNFDHGFDRALGHGALTAHRHKVLRQLVALATKGGFDGLNLDFENLAPEDRAAYTRFVRDLARRLHADGLKLIVSVPAAQKEAPGDGWCGAFDYRALGRSADWIQLMTYDQNGPGWSDPGPVAGGDWVERCLQFALTRISPHKLLLGLPAYGYHWLQRPDGTWAAGDGDGGSLPWVAAPAQAVLWDAGSQSPHVAFVDDQGARHELWFEDARSIRFKAALVARYQLAGLSMWRLGGEDLAFWQAVRAGLASAAPEPLQP